MVAQLSFCLKSKFLGGLKILKVQDFLVLGSLIICGTTDDKNVRTSFCSSIKPIISRFHTRVQ